MHLTVKIPIMDDQLTHKKAHQLERLTARDTTVIKRYLTIIEREEEQLWQQGREGRKLDSNKLDAITLTSRPLTRKNRRTGAVITTPGRLVVKYDLKMEFADRITVRELKECRDTAVELWHSYRQKVQEHERIYWKIMGNPKYFDREDELAEVLHWWKTKKKPLPPCQTKGYRLKKLPRRITIGTTAFFHEKHTKLTTFWLELYYSVGKSKNPRGCDRLWIPLNSSRYHLNQLQLGKVKRFT